MRWKGSVVGGSKRWKRPYPHRIRAAVANDEIDRDVDDAVAWMDGLDIHALPLTYTRAQTMAGKEVDVLVATMDSEMEFSIDVCE